jgi:hypothetical protein
MPPQITCPHCGSTINLENRKEVDFEKITYALNNSTKTFTELLEITNLPRKTLSLRLKDLCNSGSIVKDGGYHLSTSFKPNKKIYTTKRNGNGKMNGTMLHFGKNVQWIPAALIVCLLVIAFGSAILLSPPPQPTPLPAPLPRVGSPSLPLLSFFVSPSTTVKAGRTLMFDASKFDAFNYTWNFGDGATTTGAVVSHAYTQAGTYSVKLTVIESDGASQTAHKQVTILPNPTAVVYVDSLSDQYQVGDTITLKIMISGAMDLFAWQAGMTFDPAVLQCITEPAPSNNPTNATLTVLVEGDFLKQNGGTTIWFPGTVDNGVIMPHGDTLTSPAAPVSGSGVLGMVTFKVISQGAFDIHLTNVKLIGEDGVTQIPVFVAT